MKLEHEIPFENSPFWGCHVGFLVLNNSRTTKKSGDFWIATRIPGRGGNYHPQPIHFQVVLLAGFVSGFFFNGGYFSIVMVGISGSVIYIYIYLYHRYF